MRILVLGSAGYAGAVLTGQLLQLGYQVRSVDNFYRGNCDALLPYCENPDFEFNFGDITSYESMVKVMKGIDAVVLFSALVGEPICKKYPSLSYLVNVEGTKNVLKAKPKDVPLFFSSTGSVYGKLDEVCTEQSPLNPQSFYAIHKKCAEDIVLEAENTYVSRFSTAFGLSPSLRVNLLINDLVMQAYTNKSLVIFQGEFKRSFIHIRDFCWWISWSIQRHKSFKHKLYNVGDPNGNFSKRDIAELIKTKVPCAIFYEDIMSDPDSRNYEINFSRMLETEFTTSTSIEEGLDELVKAAPLLNMKNRYE